MMTPAAKRTITAFLDGPDSLEIRNIIHSTEGAAAYGFRGALVGGVTVFGWAVPAILEVLGEGWLDRGWADLRFRRPTYPGDTMTASAMLERPGRCEFAITNQDGERCVEGVAAAGDAPWLRELVRPARRLAEPSPAPLPALTLASAPAGEDLRPMAVPLSQDDARTYARDLQRDEHLRWTGDRPRIHPAWLAARMSPLLHHSYDYGPSIHTRTQLQLLAPAHAGPTLTIAGHFVEAYERNGHHYGVADGLVLGDDGAELAIMRHTTIFRVARRG
jgi:hypothetical protein